jgi:hypothetical protein
MADSDGQIDGGLEMGDPQRLRDDLHALYGARGEAPPRLDAAIVGMAQRHFARHRRRRLLLRTVAVSAAAASVVLVIWGAQLWDRTPVLTIPTTAVEDIDRDGRIDIRDAFLLARRLEASQPSNLRWDINRDGEVDRTDVDTIAMAAVKLDGGTIQ